MKFSANKHYLIHNFGIDYQNIFFSIENKNYFLRKIKHFITPYAKIISVKLADNQFHILIKTKKDYSGTALNHNIGIMLRSYTRAINKQRSRIGSLFCRHTKSFERISDIPKHLRIYIRPFIKFLSKGKLVDFPKTMNFFMRYLNTQFEKTSKINRTQNSKETSIFDHPLAEKITANIKLKDSA